jgi:hypothetical protein
MVCGTPPFSSLQAADRGGCLKNLLLHKIGYVIEIGGLKCCVGIIESKLLSIQSSSQHIIKSMSSSQPHLGIILILNYS